ncbi:MAG: DEAD/DEAH box helicase [Candidatus Methanomethylophilaceae archaeon]|nr:DEAD/DEAH box helicase [Candidatus Methanomethylophilaceae archaeon]
MPFQDVLRKYRTESYSEREKGARFEELIARYLMTDPAYSVQLEWVRTWNDFFGREDMGGQDTGIDLVARTKAGEYWAVQCKCYAEGHRVTKADMDTFMSASGRTFDDEGERRGFSRRLVVATTDDWTDNALESAVGQTIPVSIITLGLLEAAQVDWDAIEAGAHGDGARGTVYELRPHQQRAFDAAMEHYKGSDRGKMIMACGTGKTFTSLRIAEAFMGEAPAGGLALFLAPSISLVGQTLREWMSNTKLDLTPICVCSDRTVNKKRSEDDLGERVETLGLPSTTDPGEIQEQRRRAGGHVAIFSTYQSIDSVIEAQRAGLGEFDIVICDEAHRTTGVIIDKESETSFTKVHDNANISAKRRLYMTATPRLYGAKGKDDAEKASVVLCSMDDESIYGKEFYTIKFGEAVELELLSDYKVLILTTTSSDVPDIVRRHWTNGGKEIDADTDCKLWGCMNALAKNVAFDETLRNTDPEPMRSAVSFCRSIAVSKAVTDRFNRLAKEPMAPLRVAMDHIDGSMSAMVRDRKLGWLKGDYEGCHVLSNVRCLSEGVDVPALDAVMFLDSKGSLVDIVQSVGRVMRKAPGKRYGYIVIPIVVPEDEDPVAALDDNDRYRVVWQVLRALRSHDERLEAEINTFNYRDKTKPSDHLLPVRPIGPGGEEPPDIPLPGGQYTMDDFGGLLMARLVLKVGEKEYIENWARKVAEIMPELKRELTRLCQSEERGTKQYKPAFRRYLKGLRQCVNDDVPESQAVDMLAQQVITKPIFERLFTEDGSFAMRNSVSGYIDRMLEEIDARNGLREIQDRLDAFYRSVELTLKGIDTTDGKQKVITALYEKFFKNAFPKDQAINGVVYTPQEIVDFVIRSCAGVLEEEFGRRIGDEGVNVLDPFTGTGTFIARLMESGLVSKEDLYRKYSRELFCNEITLLAYYIAIVNIENTFARISGSSVYIPFEHALLTDTFNIDEICRHGSSDTQTDLRGEEEYFKRNKARIREEHGTQFTIIMGNPPYGANQKSANDDAKKRRYESGIDARIRETYLDESLFEGKVNNTNSVYDNYVRAFRWASDRIGDNDGIIAFVTPSGWMTGSAFEGFRRCLEREFSKAYVFNLRGDGAGTYKKEGDNVFVLGTNRGCKTGIAITLLVKKKQKEQLKVLYRDIMDMGEGYHVLEKRATLKKCMSFPEMVRNKKLETIRPKPNGDWLVQRNDAFQTLMPLAGDTTKKFEKHCEKTVFVGYSNGYKTNRDAWVYNFSEEAELSNMAGMIDEYARQTKAGAIDIIPNRIKWNDTLIASSKKKDEIAFDPGRVAQGSYRPFSKRWMYVDDRLIERSYQMPRVYPKCKENLTICVSGVGVKKDFSCLMTDGPTDLEIVGKSQCFPLYWYEDRVVPLADPRQRTLFGMEEHETVRRDGISDWALSEARRRYGDIVTKEDLFYYVYGYLHSPDYRKAFADDLRLSLPRVGLVDGYGDFLAFSRAGRELTRLHTRYEEAPPYESVRVKGAASVGDLLSMEDLHRVTKMRLFPEEGRLVYNEFVTIEGIPEEAFRYVVNGRSALGWLVDQYQTSTDKESGIVNDPNGYAGGTYVLRLVLSVITVSVETMRIVDGLPRLGFCGAGDEDEGRIAEDGPGREG